MTRPAFLDSALDRWPFSPQHTVQLLADVSILGLLGALPVAVGWKLVRVARRWVR